MDGGKWATEGPHLILRPPTWWYRIWFALGVGAAAYGAVSAAIGMWGRVIAAVVWLVLIWGAWRNAAVIDSTGVRTRGLWWRSHRWGDVAIEHKGIGRAVASGVAANVVSRARGANADDARAAARDRLARNRVVLRRRTESGSAGARIYLPGALRAGDLAPFGVLDRGTTHPGG